MDLEGSPTAGANYDALFKLVLIGDSGVGKVREKTRESSCFSNKQKEGRDVKN